MSHEVVRLTGATVITVSLWLFFREILKRQALRLRRLIRSGDRPRYSHPVLRKLQLSLINAGLEFVSVPLFIILAGFLGLILGFAAMAATKNNVMVGLAFAPLGPILASGFLDKLAQKRTALYFEQITNFIESIGNLITVHDSVYTALLEYTKKAPEPIASELRQIILGYSEGHGSSIAENMLRWADRIQNEHIALLAEAIAIYEQNGGPIQDIIQHINNNIQEKKIEHMEKESETAGQGLVVSILSVSSIALYILMRTFMPDLVKALHDTGTGRLILGIAAFNQLFVILYMRYMIGGRISN